MPEKRVTIVHPDGREYSILPEHFTTKQVSPEGSYAERGFEIVGYANGEPYPGPKSLAEIEAAAAERQAERENRQRERPAAKSKTD
jgi:hypothetical protein